MNSLATIYVVGLGRRLRTVNRWEHKVNVCSNSLTEFNKIELPTLTLMNTTEKTHDSRWLSAFKRVDELGQYLTVNLNSIDLVDESLLG